MADLDRAEAIRGWRRDYGTSLRDSAAVLTLAAETRTESIDLRALATRIAAAEQVKPATSTQENSWMLLAAAALIKDSAKANVTIDGVTVAAPLFQRFTDERIAATPVTVGNPGTESINAVVAATGIPVTPEPAGGNGFRLAREVYTPEGDLTDLRTVAQNDRFVVVLRVTAENQQGGHILVVDPIPAGFEIENPDISASGDTALFAWLKTDTPSHTEARTDRFVAAFDRGDRDPLDYSVAYTMRAVSPGTFAAPAATVEDMYRPELYARAAAATVEVVGPTR
jgi:uncharacterized protein YfaS (alpha-2-macroglobulin family)